MKMLKLLFFVILLMIPDRVHGGLNFLITRGSQIIHLSLDACMTGVIWMGTQAFYQAYIM